jgi:hypothetical protein
VGGQGVDDVLVLLVQAGVEEGVGIDVLVPGGERGAEVTGFGGGEEGFLFVGDEPGGAGGRPVGEAACGAG